MQPFYLSKNSCGYYKAYFVDTETGKVLKSKSTHSKNKFEANIIATNWLNNTLPEERTTTKSDFSKPNQIKSFLNLDDIAKRITRDEAEKLIILLKQKFEIKENINYTVSENHIIKKHVENKYTCETKPVYLLSELRKFWDYNNSEYIKKKQLRGYDIKKRNCKEKLGIVNRYYGLYFTEDKTIQSLTTQELDTFLMNLRDKKGLSADTVNKTMSTGNMVFEFLVNEKVISNNPMKGIERFKVNSKKRDIPTETEMKQLMKLDWNWTDNVYKLGFKMSALFGLRAGEISGLQTCDVDPIRDLLYIRHSWSTTDKLKTTKNGDDRVIPIEHNIALELLNQAKRNPNYSDVSFIFYSPVVENQPLDPKIFERDFYIAMEKIGISETQRKQRNIVFHSLRHYCATQIAQRASLEIAMKILGHKTQEMTRLYSEHETKMKLDNAKDVLAAGWNTLLIA